MGNTNIVPCVHSRRRNPNVRTTVYNEAVYDVCRWDLDFEWPKNANLGRLISHIICSLTASIQSSAP